MMELSTVHFWGLMGFAFIVGAVMGGLSVEILKRL
jgi:uncharacterized membrane protein